MSAKLGGNLRSAMQQAKKEALSQTATGTETALFLSNITLSVSQPRRYFDPVAIEALKRSIAEKGILQPLLVRPVGEGIYELVAGERRYRAAKELGLNKVPAIIKELDDLEAVEVALTENLQREDLNPIDETEGVLQLLALKLEIGQSEVVSLLYSLQNAAKGKITHNVMGNTQEMVERTLETVGKMGWQSFVTNRLPLLKLPEDVLQILREGRLPYTKAVILARVKDVDKRCTLLDEALTKDLSVADLRREIQKLQISTTDRENSLEVRARNLTKLLKRNSVLTDKTVKKRVEKLLGELEALLSS